MTELRASLLKWEQLEPARVWRDVHGLLVVQVGKRSTSHLTQPGLLLAAVIEAAEARGWDWNLTSMLPWNATARRYVATVTYHVKEADSDVAALLGAYLAALEAEAKQ